MRKNRMLALGLLSLGIPTSSFGEFSKVNHPFDFTLKHRYEAYLVERWDAKCKEEKQVDDSRRYNISVNPNTEYTEVYIEKLVPTFSFDYLLSSTGVTSTNALDFASFKYYPDGKYEFVNAADNVRAYKEEKQKVNFALSKDKKYWARKMGLMVSMEKFEESLENEIKERYGIIFDISNLGIISENGKGNLNPSVYNYKIYPYLNHKSQYSVSRSDNMRIDTHIYSTGSKSTGRCNPEELEKYKEKDSFFYKMERSVCNMNWSMNTTYVYLDSKNIVISIDREITIQQEDGVDRKYCTYYKLIQ